MTWNPKVNWHLGNQWKTNCELFWFARVCVLFPQWWTSYPSMILGWLNYQLRRCFKLHQNSVRNPWDNLTCHIPSWNCVSKEPETLLGYLSRCIDMCIRTPPLLIIYPKKLKCYPQQHDSFSTFSNTIHRFLLEPLDAAPELAEHNLDGAPNLQEPDVDIAPELSGSFSGTTPGSFAVASVHPGQWSGPSLSGP